MTEPSEDPAIQELFKRMAALEDEKRFLLDRVASLERRAESDHKYFMTLASQVGDLINQVGMIDLQVIEITEKSFPGYIRTQQQIMTICNLPKKANEQGEDQPD